ncbi:hypothetical protein V8E54_013549 [Elaphomyces granulatus]
MPKKPGFERVKTGVAAVEQFSTEDYEKWRRILKEYNENNLQYKETLRNLNYIKTLIRTSVARQHHHYIYAKATAYDELSDSQQPTKNAEFSANKTKQLFNIKAALQWAPKHRKHMSIFLSMHEWIRTKKSSFTLDGTSRTEKITVAPTVNMITDAFSIPDDSKIKIPPLYIHIPGTPVMTTENEHPGLKHVNGAEFKSVAVIPDARYPGYAISEGITIHFGPPAGLLVTRKRHF